MSDVKGTNIMEQMAKDGLKLFAPEATSMDVDVPGAEKYKAAVDVQITLLETKVAELTGKDNKKQRSAKGKEISELKAGAQYIDACKVVKGLEPRNGFFVKTAPDLIIKAKQATPSGLETVVAKEEPKKVEKKTKKPTETAGLSPAERTELEQLKKDIMERKAQLKAEGLSGGQQNKDQQVVDWVKRMNELKEKEAPGSTQDAKKKDAKKSSRAPLSSEEQKELDALRLEIDTYKHRLRTEFGYSAKDMKTDEDLLEMEKKLAALEKRSG